MAGLTPDDVRHWDPSVINQMFEAAKGVYGTNHKLGEALQHGESRVRDWRGEGADAFRAEIGKTRADIDETGAQATGVSRAIINAERDVTTARADMNDIDDDARAFQWTVTPTWQIDTSSNPPLGEGDPLAMQLVALQGRLTTLQGQAESADHELGLAIRAAVGDAQVTPQGYEAHGQPPAPPPMSKTTPGDQLPLTPKDGQLASPTEGTAERHDHRELGGSGYLSDNPHPSPLLAGLSADQWRQRLAHYNPGDPLPDPRTPTGDKAIDSLANAAGQQNATYAWGGNRSLTGPSKGHGDDGGDATKMDDLHRVGYDCGGLVRYSVQQGAGFDVGMGTGAIDSNSRFAHPKDLMQVPSAGVGGKAQPGDVLVFTKGTGHTGIYIGNGFMINAPDSGNPVRVDLVGPGRGPTDILRIPSQ